MPIGIYVRMKPVSQETRLKMSIARKGFEVSEETRKKLSKISKGRKFTKEQRKRMSIAHIGVMKGIKLSEEHKKRIGIANIGRKFSDETKKKMSIQKLGKLTKGGINYKRGYKFVYTPDHPYAVNKYIKNSRLVIEKIIGRYLQPSEHIHHKNSIRNDDRPENLKIISCSEHMRHHRLLSLHNRKKDNLGRFI